MNERPQIHSGDSRIQPILERGMSGDRMLSTSASEGPGGVGADQPAPPESHVSGTAPVSSSPVSTPNDPDTVRRIIRAACHQPGNDRCRLPFSFPRGSRSAPDLRHERHRRT
jgi:hypothetical protein